ncbi:MAG: SAM-dependent chlorinase/fluorinase [Myxococcota bacterium]|nr:SAM-dependent chlorinase/fluorinase [Myxococcota bacterium]
MIKDRENASTSTVWLLTDFGVKDAYVGTMKAVICGISRNSIVHDLTHGITPQSICEGAFVLETVLPYLPDGAIVVAVVDPGVGSARKALAVRTDKHTFVAPDNGLLTQIFNQCGPAHIVALNQVHYWLNRLSATFHGRDLFAPIAGHLAAGVPMTALGETVSLDDCVRLSPPRLESSADGRRWVGEVLYVDGFGNCITSIPNDVLRACSTTVVDFEGSTITGIHRTFSDVAVDEPVAYLGSAGRLEIGVRNGHAAGRFRLAPGALITVAFG